MVTSRSFSVLGDCVPILDGFVSIEGGGGGDGDRKWREGASVPGHLSMPSSQEPLCSWSPTQ